MNSLLTIVFVAVVTLLCKWLLFDDDQPVEQTEATPPLQIADTPSEPKPSPFSKTA